MKLADRKHHSVLDRWRCPDGGLDDQGFYGHLHSGWDMRLCADDIIRCRHHADEFDRQERR